MKTAERKGIVEIESAIPAITQDSAPSNAEGVSLSLKIDSSENAETTKQHIQQEAINHYATLNQIGQRSARRRLTEY